MYIISDESNKIEWIRNYIEKESEIQHLFLLNAFMVATVLNFSIYKQNSYRIYQIEGCLNKFGKTKH